MSPPLNESVAVQIYNREGLTIQMANRYSKVNTQNKVNGDNEYRELQQFEEKSSITPGARLMAIIVIAAMIITTFLAAGIFMYEILRQRRSSKEG